MASISKIDIGQSPTEMWLTVSKTLMVFNIRVPPGSRVLLRAGQPKELIPSSTVQVEGFMVKPKTPVRFDDQGDVVGLSLGKEFRTYDGMVVPVGSELIKSQRGWAAILPGGKPVRLSLKPPREDEYVPRAVPKFVRISSVNGAYLNFDLEAIRKCRENQWFGPILTIFGKKGISYAKSLGYFFECKTIAPYETQCTNFLRFELLENSIPVDVNDIVAHGIWERSQVSYSLIDWQAVKEVPSEKQRVFQCQFFYDRESTISNLTRQPKVMRRPQTLFAFNRRQSYSGRLSRLSGVKGTDLYVVDDRKCLLNPITGQMVVNGVELFFAREPDLGDRMIVLQKGDNGWFFDKYGQMKGCHD
ncbi:MAG: hypothetical protein H6624_07005 [Bdellovibrionaceae bacterium]|nr:hypothetical protein [Bdellovibrionales bacterium]MCB9084075.1 hypothetical protein [Pseudobdellovibrionaceae bacterium]